MMRVLKALLAASLLVLPACAGLGSYVWVNELPQAEVAREYRIRSGDLVNITVFQQDAMSTKSHVRSDGKLAVPILGDIDIRGQRPEDVRVQLEARLKEFVVTPHVTVTVDESQPVEVSVIGEVARPGNFVLKPNTGIAHALASAGGKTDFASLDRIFVLRPPKRIRFTYESIVRGEGRSATFVLEPGDVIVVE
jgi:polysaccharide biosynthesis/export protein